jgi:tetratricopeptide (TPR) repeat protein
MQDQSQGHHRIEWIHRRPIVTAIVAYFIVLAILVGLVAIAYRPLLARYHYSQGYTSGQRKDFDTAIIYYTEAIRLDPRYSDAYFARGFAWNEMKQFDSAIADYSEAIRLDPQNASTYLNRAYVHSGKKEFKTAIADYTEAIRLRPNDAEAYKNRGFARSSMKEYEKALADFNQAIRLEPNDAFSYVSVAWILTNSPDKRIRDTKRAVAMATKACEMSGWKAASHLESLAAACAATSDLESAVKWQTAANRLHSDPQEKTAGEQRLRYFQYAVSQSEAVEDR